MTVTEFCQRRNVMSDEIEQYRSEKLGYFTCFIRFFFFHFFRLKFIFEVFIGKYSSCKA